MKFVVFIALLLGFYTEPNLLKDDVPRLLITMFGLMSTGILPAISLIVGNAVSSSFSPARLNDLDNELNNLINRLFSVLAVALIGSAALIVIVVGVPELPSITGKPIFDKYIVTSPSRLIHAIVFASLIFVGDRLRLVWVTFQRVRELRTEIAKADSRTLIENRAPADTQIKDLFPTSDNFGKSVDIKQTDVRD